MKVILLENLAKIGSIGEIIDVKRGLRNYLILIKLYMHLNKISKKLKNVWIKKKIKKKTSQTNFDNLITKHLKKNLLRK